MQSGDDVGDQARAQALDLILQEELALFQALQLQPVLRRVGGELLAVPQFTLAADTNSGLRPSFSSAAAPDEGQAMFLKFVEKAAEAVHVATGRFGADMKVSLLNDGPVTFWLEVPPHKS